MIILHQPQLEKEGHLAHGLKEVGSVEPGVSWFKGSRSGQVAHGLSDSGGSWPGVGQVRWLMVWCISVSSDQD